MKKNAILFFILISLLTFTYLFQEKGLWSKKLKSQTTFLEMKELDSISFKDGSISFKPTPMIENLKFPADSNALDRFLKMLQSIVIKKEIQIDETTYKNYFSPDAHRVKVRKNNLVELEFILGEPVPGTEEFYWLEKKDNVSTVFIASFEEALRNGESQYYNPGDKYKHLTQMLDLSSETFFLPNIFPEGDLNHFASITFYPKELTPFEIPLNTEMQQKIKPEFSLTWNVERIEIFKQGLSKLKATSLVRKLENAETILEMTLTTLNNQKASFKIYKAKESDSSFFLQKDESPLWFSLGVGVQDLFIVPKEDFWLKKISFENKVPKSSDLILKQSKNSLTLSYSPNPSPALVPLLDLVYSKSPWNQADRISPLRKNDPLLLINPLELNMDGLNLFLTHKNDEIILINKKDGYVLHYYLTNERAHHKIKFNLEEYK
jgi:hypothetical protein